MILQYARVLVNRPALSALLGRMRKEKGERIKEKGERGANLHDEGHGGSCKRDLGQGGRFGVATGNTQFNSDYTLYVSKLPLIFFFFVFWKICTIESSSNTMETHLNV